MATTLHFLIPTIMLIFSAIGGAAAKSQPFSRSLSPGALGLKKEKLSHLHDIVVSSNPTAIQVIRPLQSSSSTFFGMMVMVDDPLTLEPEINSKLVGRAQGMYAAASQSDEVGLLTLFNLVFLEGKYNGSTLTMMGRNAVSSSIREMPIVGGSGVFPFARGYAQTRTHTFDPATGNAVAEDDLYVFHY